MVGVFWLDCVYFVPIHTGHEGDSNPRLNLRVGLVDIAGSSKQS